MAPRVLIVNPSGEEGRGILGDVLLESGASVEELATKEAVDLLVAGAPSPTVRVVPELPRAPGAHDALIVLGSPLGVLTDSAGCGKSSRSPTSDDPQTPAGLIEQIEVLVRAFHEEEKPVLGICLGAQLVARAFGGSVFKMPSDPEHTAMPVQLSGEDPPVGVEFGWHAQDFSAEAEADPVVGPALREWRGGLESQGTNASLPPKFAQWHSDTFSLPPGAVHLSSRPTCPAQAFRLGRCTYAFQYHIEVDEEMAKGWVSDYLEGNDSYTKQENWEGVDSQQDQEAMKAQLASIIAEGSVQRARRFTRSLLLSLLERAPERRPLAAAAAAALPPWPLLAAGVAVGAAALFALARRRG